MSLFYPKKLTHVLVEPSPLARRLLWHTLSLHLTTIERPYHHPPFEKPGGQIFWVRSGGGELEWNTRRIPIQPGRRLWLTDMAGPRIYYPEPGRTLTFCGFRFGGPCLESWLEELDVHANPEFSLPDLDFIRRARQRLVGLVKERPFGWEWQVHKTIDEILGKLLMARKGVLPSTELATPVVRVLNAVATQPTRDWQARELAQVAKLSYSRLRTLFRASQHETLHQYLQQVRLDEAKLLLADHRLLIKDVAARLNFSSEFHFSRFFRFKTGLSPTQFRARVKG